MAGVSAGAGTGKGTTATFVAPLTPGAEAQQSAVTVTLPQGGTNVSIAIGLTINGVIGDPTKPTIGFPFSWCKKTTVAPGRSSRSRTSCRPLGQPSPRRRSL